MSLLFHHALTVLRCLVLWRRGLLFLLMAPLIFLHVWTVRVLGLQLLWSDFLRTEEEAPSWESLGLILFCFGLLGVSVLIFRLTPSRQTMIPVPHPALPIHPRTRALGEALAIAVGWYLAGIVALCILRWTGRRISRDAPLVERAGTLPG